MSISSYILIFKPFIHSIFNPWVTRLLSCKQNTLITACHRAFYYWFIFTFFIYINNIAYRVSHVLTIIYISFWSRKVPFSFSTKVRRRPCQVEIIVDIFKHFLWNLDWRVVSVESCFEILLIKWIWYIVGLLNWIAVIIL